MTTNVFQKVTSQDGTIIAYDRLGQGPVLRLVAAALSTREEVAPLAGLLAEQFTVINYDRRGRGDSTNAYSGSAGSGSVQREVEDIAALIEAAGGRASLFGSSSGAVLALEAANRLAGRVEKLALFEPPFIVDDSRPPVPADYTARVAGLATAGKRGEAVEFFMGEAVGIPAEFLAEMKQSPMWPAMEALAHTLAYDGAVMGETQRGKPLHAGQWPGVTASTLVMAGGESPDWLRNAGQSLANTLPNAQYRELAGLDHSAAVMAPDALAPVLVEYLF